MNRMEEMEICRLYKEAKYQKLQERILADMFLCEVVDIREILERNGIYNPDGRVKGNRNINGRAKGKQKNMRKGAGTLPVNRRAGFLSK